MVTAKITSKNPKTPTDKFQFYDSWNTHSYVLSMNLVSLSTLIAKPGLVSISQDGSPRTVNITFIESWVTQLSIKVRTCWMAEQNTHC